MQWVNITKLNPILNTKFANRPVFVLYLQLRVPPLNFETIGYDSTGQRPHSSHCGRQPCLNYIVY